VDRFDALVGKVMSTPHAQIKRRIEAERKASELKPASARPETKTFRFQRPCRFASSLESVLGSRWCLLAGQLLVR
jgi:hypothetical protein